MIVRHLQGISWAISHKAVQPSSQCSYIALCVIARCTSPALLIIHHGHQTVTVGNEEDSRQAHLLVCSADVINHGLSEMMFTSKGRQSFT